MKQVFGMALRGALGGAAVGWALLLLVFAFNLPSDVGDALEALLGVSLLGGTLGLGVGIAVGAARASYQESEPRRLFQSCGRLSFAAPVSEAPGLGPLDLVVALAYGLASTSLLLVSLLGVFGGPGRLARAISDSSPLSLGPAHALLMLSGTALVSMALLALVALSRKPPMRFLDRSHARGLTASGFVAGLVWPGLLLVLLV